MTLSHMCSAQFKAVQNLETILLFRSVLNVFKFQTTKATWVK